MMPIGRIPITRAAWMYSLFFSTSAEPRTVRAYCGQLEMPIAKISTFQSEFLRFLGSNHPEIGSAIVTEKVLSDATIAALKQAIGEFKQTFTF